MKVDKTQNRIYLLDKSIAHGNRQQTYLVIGHSSSRYCTVHCTKNKRICSVTGHEGSGRCDHVHLVPKLFMQERFYDENEEIYDSDDDLLVGELPDRQKEIEEFILPPVSFIFFFFAICNKFCFEKPGNKNWFPKKLIKRQNIGNFRFLKTYILVFYIFWGNRCHNTTTIHLPKNQKTKNKK